MDFDNNNDISKFLDQFEKENSEVERAFASGKASFNEKEQKTTNKNASEESFKKLEEKIGELEKKFEVSLQEKAVLAAELSKTKEDVEKQKSKEEFFNNIAGTIASLKESVDRMSVTRNMPARPFAQQEVYEPGYYYGAPINQASVFGAQNAYMQAASALEKQNKIIEEQKGDLRQKDQKILKQEEENLAQSEEILRQRNDLKKQEADKAEQERAISGLREKTSRLKAVNMALDKEFKRVQEEKIEALRKSAEQAKEILSLREQLNAAEERFKSFDFEGRIISIKNHYEQKVATLENQLQEMSAVCMKQVEEIEALKTENLSLKDLEASRIILQTQYSEKVGEVEALKAEIEKISKANEEAAAANSELAKANAQLMQTNDEILRSSGTSAKTLMLDSETRLEAVQKQAAAQIAAIKAEYEGKDETRTKEMAVRIKQIAEESDRKIADLEAQLASAAGAQKRELSLKTAFSEITNSAEKKINALQAKLAELQAERDGLELQLRDSTLSEGDLKVEKERLQATFKTLNEQMKSNDVIIDELKKKIEVLTTENTSLKTSPKAKEVSVAPEVTAPPAAVTEVKVRSKEEAQSARAASKAKSSNGEERDFLADTQSFVGRLRWSLLKED